MNCVEADGEWKGGLCVWESVRDSSEKYNWQLGILILPRSRERMSLYVSVEGGRVSLYDARSSQVEKL